ncbi:MAG: Sensory box histidine kinase/response regulator [Nitrospira sp.]|nr:MAG: Sensory box histidine kinase/response regulator [Nitrospira sp.]
MIGTALAGFGWGASALVLFSPSSPAHQVFLTFVLGGVTAGASSTLAARFDAFLSFSLPTLLPLVLRFFILGTEQALAMGICTLLFSCLMAYTAFRMFNTVSETLRLKYHNARLVDQLAAQLQEGEQTELLLNVHTEHYRFIMEQAQDIFYRTDGNGRFTFINPAVVRLLGYHETELLGHRALDFIHPSHRRTMVNFYIRQFLRKIPSTYYEFPLCATQPGTAPPEKRRDARRCEHVGQLTAGPWGPGDRFDRILRRCHRTQTARRPTAPSPQDGRHRPFGRQGCSRFQQFADRHQRLCRPLAGTGAA